MKFTNPSNREEVSPNSPLDADALLKKATSLKDAGKIDDAVETLRQAYWSISKTSIQYDIATFLRLPLYLQAAGRNDEAWREFNLLLTHGYPNQSFHDPVVCAYDKAAIYDKMRLFLQRERKNSLAVIYGVLSYISDLRARYIGGQSDSVIRQYFEQYVTKETYTSILTKLLKKAKQLHKLDRICRLMEDSISKLPEGDDFVLRDSIARILNEE